jgi:hypothetical protein
MSDPVLTSSGRAQVQDWSNRMFTRTLGDRRDILIVVSPLTRAIETALVAFAPLLGNEGMFRSPTKALILPHIQEASNHRCNTPLPLDELRSRFPNLTDIFDCSLRSFLHALLSNVSSLTNLATSDSGWTVEQKPRRLC